MFGKNVFTIFGALRKFVQEARNLPKTKPLKVLTETTKDNLMECKLTFFKVIALKCEPFLRKFQTPKINGPFSVQRPLVEEYYF